MKSPAAAVVTPQLPTMEMILYRDCEIARDSHPTPRSLPMMEMGLRAKRNRPITPMYLLRQPADHSRIAYSSPKNTTSTISWRRRRDELLIAPNGNVATGSDDNDVDAPPPPRLPFEADDNDDAPKPVRYWKAADFSRRECWM